MKAMRAASSVLPPMRIRLPPVPRKAIQRSCFIFAHAHSQPDMHVTDQLGLSSIPRWRHYGVLACAFGKTVTGQVLLPRTQSSLFCISSPGAAHHCGMLGRNKILDVRELSVRSPVPLQVLCCLVLFASSLATAGTPSPTMQARVRAATFEIVMKKPETDSLTYERPLPLELLPYKERNDPYISIGSAFAIGENRFVTAAHVLSLGFRTQYGPPALRGADGVVHAIDQIHKYSSAQDFA